MSLNTGGIFQEFVSNVMIAEQWPLHLVVLIQSTGRCTTMAPPIHLDPSTSSSVRSSSGLPTHLNASTSGQHLGLYLHLRL
jgi:hypothetical protein